LFLVLQSLIFDRTLSTLTEVRGYFGSSSLGLSHSRSEVRCRTLSVVGASELYPTSVLLYCGPFLGRSLSTLTEVCRFVRCWTLGLGSSRTEVRGLLVVYHLRSMAQLSLITAIIFNNGNYIELPGFQGTEIRFLISPNYRLTHLYISLPA